MVNSRRRGRRHPPSWLTLLYYNGIVFWSLFPWRGSATLHVTSPYVTFPSIPAVYYGKPWIANTTITARLLYYDLDWCTESDLLDPTRSPIHIESEDDHHDHGNGSDDDLPIALLIDDERRSNRYGYYPCQLIDYERLATIWNVSYIIFQDGIDRPLSYVWTYLDDRIMSETNHVGYQLVSYQTGNDLRTLIVAQNENHGIVVELDDISAVDVGPRITQSFQNRRKWINLLPKCTGFFSMMGSAYIIYSIVGTTRGRNQLWKLTFNRFLVALSIADILSSVAIFLSTWMFPSQPPYGVDPTWWNAVFPYASGNEITCTLQGTMFTLGQCGSMYFTACISLQVVLQVRHGWTITRMREAERSFFLWGIVLPLGTAITMASIGAIAPTTGGTCWVSTDPIFCIDSNVGWCIEHRSWGEYYLYCLLISVLWMLGGLLVVLVCMCLIYQTARTTERRTRRFSTTGQEGRAQRAIIKTASQYLGVYVVIYVVAILSFAVSGKDDGWQFFTVTTLLPLQGFFNAMIYSKKYELLFTCVSKVLRVGSRTRTDSDTMSMRSSRFIRAYDRMFRSEKASRAPSEYYWSQQSVKNLGQSANIPSTNELVPPVSSPREKKSKKERMSSTEKKKLTKEYISPMSSGQTGTTTSTTSQTLMSTTEPIPAGVVEESVGSQSYSEQQPDEKENEGTVKFARLTITGEVVDGEVVSP